MSERSLGGSESPWQDVARLLSLEEIPRLGEEKTEGSSRPKHSTYSEAACRLQEPPQLRRRMLIKHKMLSFRDLIMLSGV